MNVTPHSLAAKILHWGFIVFFLYALSKQLDEVDELEDVTLLEQEMTFAILFLFVLAVRFVYMHITRPTAMPVEISRRTRIMARAVHVGMYVSLSLIALSGLVIGGLYSAEIKSGGAMDAALLVHEIAVNTTYFLILGHVGAAIYHRLKEDGIWSSMVPIWKERTRE